MTAPPPKKLLRLKRSIARYDFAKEPLFSADIVIDKTGRVAKHRDGKAGGNATAEQIKMAHAVGPNR